MRKDGRTDGRKDRWTDGQIDRPTDMTKITVAFSNFANIPNDIILYIFCATGTCKQVCRQQNTLIPEHKSTLVSAIIYSRQLCIELSFMVYTQSESLLDLPLD